jgi:hypothetical protein
MGNNIDFMHLMNVPSIKCPKCKRSFDNQLEEWDIDCGTRFQDSTYTFEIECEDCNNTSRIDICLNTEVYVNRKKLMPGTDCKECSEELDTKEEKEFGMCNKCCANKYRELNK